MNFGGSATNLRYSTIVAMRDAGLHTFLDVARLSAKDFRRVKGIGAASASAVHAELKARGLRFADEAESAYMTHFTEEMANHLAQRAENCARTYFRDLLFDELDRMRKAKLDMTKIEFDDYTENSVVIFYQGDEYARISVDVKATIRRKRR